MERTPVPFDGVFRSIVERGDMVAVHEPFSDLAGLDETDVEGRPFHSPVALLDWLRDQTHDVDVFLKDTPDHRHQELLADWRFPCRGAARVPHPPS